MIEPNNEKNIYLYKVLTAGEKLSEYAKFFGKKSENWDKSIKSKIRDCHSKTGTVGIFGVRLM